MNPKIRALVKAIAGEKLPKVEDLANELICAGKSPERAYADALETLKLLKNKPKGTSEEE